MTEALTKTRAATTSLLLSALFLVVYGATNWIASARSNVGTWYLEWELTAIPFIPLMIIPYMSIDLFFVAAPFLCRDRRSLDVLASRIAFSILVAGVCFLLLPLRLGFERQPVEGWLGGVFGAFLALDQPYNLFPSLHIALRTILVELYARRTSGLMNVAVHIWFSLVGLSTLLTHQHHLVDVAGGFVLAAFSMYLFRPSTTRLPVVPNLRVGSCYALVSVALVGLGAATWRWGILLLWPAVATAIVAVAYAGLGPGIYRKTEGRLPWSTRFVLGPVILGQYVSLLYYRRRCRPGDAVTPRLIIGRRLGDELAAEAVADGVTAVLDLTAEFSEARPFLETNYRNLPVLDLTAPTPEHLQDSAAFITEQVKTGKLYVHCKIGYSRSAAAVAAYLLSSGRARSAEDAIEHLRGARPSIIVRPEVREALERFATRLADGAGERRAPSVRQ